MLFLVALLLTCALYAATKLLLHLLSTGFTFRMPFTRFCFRRWQHPTNLEACKQIQADLRLLSQRSVGLVVDYDAMTDPTKLYNRIVLVLYDSADKMRPAAFHMPLTADPAPGILASIYHIGLIMVDPKYRGRGLQRWLIMLNMMSPAFRHMMSPCIVTGAVPTGGGGQGPVGGTRAWLTCQPRSPHTTLAASLARSPDIGDSPSALRQIGRMGRDSFPSMDLPSLAPKPWHVTVARHMMERHRRDFGTSANAVLREDSFVVERSNEPTGGGTAVVRVHACTGGAGSAIEHQRYLIRLCTGPACS